MQKASEALKSEQLMVDLLRLTFLMDRCLRLSSIMFKLRNEENKIAGDMLSKDQIYQLLLSTVQVMYHS
jgi:hypothetical protein